MPLKLNFEEQPALNLTSMIDVLFLLIIFFIVGTRFKDMERSVNLQVPKVGQNAALAETSAKKNIHVTREGEIQFDGATVTLDELTTRLTVSRRQNPELSVLVRGDGDGRLQNTASVLAACRKAGITDVGIAVEIASQSQIKK